MDNLLFRKAIVKIRYAAASLAILQLGLTACALAPGGAAAETPTPPATPIPQVVSITPALRPLAERLNDCALQTPGLALYIEELPASALPEAGAVPGSFSARLGEGPQTAPFAVSLGEEEVRVIVHPDNPVTEIGEEELRGLFEGSIVSWSEIGGEERAVSPWVYPAGEELQTLFESSLLQGADPASTTGLAPTPQQMIAAVAAEQGAVGFIPASWPQEQIAVVRLPDSLQARLSLPVLVQAPEEPQGASRTFLSCLQERGN